MLSDTGLENDAKQRYVSLQFLRCEIELQEQFRVRQPKVFREAFLQSINSFKLCRIGVGNCTARSFQYLPNMTFELPDEIADAIKTTGANDRFDFGFAFRNYPVDFQIHNQFAINDATEIFKTRPAP